MRAEITLDFSGPLKMVKDMLEATSATGVDKFLEDEVGEILRKDFDKQFGSAGYPDRWVPLAKSTVAQKRGKGYPRLGRSGKPSRAGMQNGAFGPENILIRRGDLRISWSKRDGQDHVCRAKAGELEIGSANPYAIYHQSEEPRKLKSDGTAKLPRRPLVITDEATTLIVEKTIEHILGVKR